MHCICSAGNQRTVQPGVSEEEKDELKEERRLLEKFERDGMERYLYSKRREEDKNKLDMQVNSMLHE